MRGPRPTAACSSFWLLGILLLCSSPPENLSLSWRGLGSLLLQVESTCVNVTAAHLKMSRASVSKMNESTSNHDGWRLPFCGDAPPFLWAPINASASSADIESTIMQQDAIAAADYAKMVSVLSTFDCTRKYSYFTCEHCRTFYKRWICLMRLPRCTVGVDQHQNEVMADPPCLDSCTDVLRACPYNIDFSCPSAHSLFGHDYSTDKSVCDPGI